MSTATRSAIKKAKEVLAKKMRPGPVVLINPSKDVVIPDCHIIIRTVQNTEKTT